VSPQTVLNKFRPELFLEVVAPEQNVLHVAVDEGKNRKVHIGDQVRREWGAGERE
jgi:hypothetical protein